MPTPARVEFDVKHFEIITASMLNYLTGVQSLITDYNIGSINRTLLEAVAMELEELYYRTFKALERAIPEAVYTAFDFVALPATTASGVVTFAREITATQDYLIPAGTQVATESGVAFTVTEEVTLPTGSTSVIASVLCTTPGQAGNVGAGAVTVLRTAITGIESVTNAAAMTGGTDSETESSRNVRFQAFVSSLSRSPIAGVEAGAKTAKLLDPNTGVVLQRVVNARLYEDYRLDSTKPAGLATLYIDSGSGSASDALVTECQRIIDGYLDPVTNAPVMGYKAAGVAITVVAASVAFVVVQCSVVLRKGTDVDTATSNLKLAVQEYFDGLEIGDGVDRNALIVTLMSVEGVRAVALAAPTTDLTTAPGLRYRSASAIILAVADP